MSVQTVNFSVLAFQFRLSICAGVSANERNGTFLTSVREGGAADTRTPLDLLDTDSPILACSRLSDRGEGAKTYEQKKNLLFHLSLFFSFFCCTVA